MGGSRLAAGFAPAACAAIALAWCPAGAQPADQTALEQLFGEPVTTSVTGKPQRVSEVPAEMTIITADQIRRSGAQSIPDILRFVPGIDVRSYGEADQAVGIRGNTTALNPRVLVLLDGRQVYQDDYGLTVWSLIPVALIEIRQIEIIKGPSAALYGFNAVDGVINIITYDPLRDKLNAVRATGGTQSQASGEAVATAQIADRLGVRLSAAGFRSTEYPGEQGYGTRQQPHSGMVAADARAQLAPGLEWDVSGSMSSLDSDYYVDTGVYEPLGFKANSLRSRLSDDTAFGILSLDAYRNENHTSDTSPIVSSHWREDVTVVQASDVVKLGSHTLRAALEYRDNTVTSQQAFNGRIGYADYAGSLMWTWRALPYLSVTNAMRVDSLFLSHAGPQQYIATIGNEYISRRFLEPSFNSGAVVRLSGDDTIRLTAARAEQLPSLIDFGYALDDGAASVSGNTRLQPSATLHYEIDYDRNLAWPGARLRLALFTQRTDTALGSPFGSGYVVSDGKAIFAARNFGGSNETGGEIGIRSSGSSGLRWNLSYAFAAVHDQSPIDQLLKAPSVSYQLQTPIHSVVFGAGYDWGRLEFDLQARWQSHFTDTAIVPQVIQFIQVSVPNYITMDARLGYRLTDRITISAVAQQLNSRSIIVSAGVPVARRIVASVRVQF